MQEKKYLEKKFRILGNAPQERQSIPMVQLSFKIAQQQQIEEGGLEFTLVVTNNSADDLKIENPLDYLQILIQDGEGWPVNLPLGSPPRALSNTRGPSEIIRPFKVESIESSLGESNLMGIVNDEDILLKGKASYQFVIRVDKVMDTDKNNRTARTNKTKPIAQGKYKVNINVSIVLSDNKAVYKQNESGYLEVELI